MTGEVVLIGEAVDGDVIALLTAEGYAVAYSDSLDGSAVQLPGDVPDALLTALKDLGTEPLMRGESSVPAGGPVVLVADDVSPDAIGALESEGFVVLVEPELASNSIVFPDGVDPEVAIGFEEHQGLDVVDRDDALQRPAPEPVSVDGDGAGPDRETGPGPSGNNGRGAGRAGADHGNDNEDDRTTEPRGRDHGNRGRPTEIGPDGELGDPILDATDPAPILGQFDESVLEQFEDLSERVPAADDSPSDPVVDETYLSEFGESAEGVGGTNDETAPPSADPPEVNPITDGAGGFGADDTDNSHSGPPSEPEPEPVPQLPDFSEGGGSDETPTLDASEADGFSQAFGGFASGLDQEFGVGNTGWDAVSDEATEQIMADEILDFLEDQEDAADLDPIEAELDLVD